MAVNKPVIFCVDDDAEVLAAIDRDLRQYYKSEYRIIKANSAREATEAARKLKQRAHRSHYFSLTSECLKQRVQNFWPK
jgi:CheY-like chemotaxis protein